MPLLQNTSAQHSCGHPIVTTSLSPHAQSTAFRPYSAQQILTAMTGKRKHPLGAAAEHRLEAFPEPLVLPGDAIDLDPKYPPQSFRSWLNLGVRNQVTARRNFIYVAAPPELDSSVSFMKDWSQPKRDFPTDQQAPLLTNIDVQGVVSYLRACYHGLEVKLLPTALTFTSWDDSPRLKSKPRARTKARKEHHIQAVALSTGTEAIRIQVRSTPPADSESPEYVCPYSYQLDLNNLTDVALTVLPSDAYALLLLTQQDMYESDDDDFCCGRAWGASRVAIVSGARYQPCLDGVHAVDGEHIWPASHCKEFVDKRSFVGSDGQTIELQNGTKRRKITEALQPREQDGLSPLSRAVEAQRTTSLAAGNSAVDVQSTFLFRLCRTVSHELGHCFGLDHCMYKACMMQGTASVAEDMRQPPYLCPVCELKVAWAIVPRNVSGAGDEIETRATRAENTARREQVGGDMLEAELTKWKRDRHAVMKRFCEQQSSAFNPLLAWSAAFLEAGQS